MRILDESPPSVEAAVLRIKCLCELDRADEARAAAQAALRDFPANALLQYYLGMTQYLAGGDATAIEAAFHAAHATSEPAGHMGMAFLAYTRGATDVALASLERATGVDAELEHVRLLMMFQVALDAGQFPVAEQRLEDADLVLRDTPSLLRSLWGQLCWVRLLHATRMPDLAVPALRRLKAQLSSERTPRLFRNVSDLEPRLTAAEGAYDMRMPGGNSVRRSFLPDDVLRRPTLSCLFHFLEARGDFGASKEEIVRHVWDTAYNPITHDDRLYKSIGRLRKLLDTADVRAHTLFLRGNNYVLRIAQ